MNTKPDEFSDVRAALIGEREPDVIEWYEYTTRLLAAVDKLDKQVADARDEIAWLRTQHCEVCSNGFNHNCGGVG